MAGSTDLPRIWPGIAIVVASPHLALLALTAQAVMIGANGLAATLSMLLVGVYMMFPVLIYWCFCIYRIHQVLQSATNGLYPVSPLKALLITCLLNPFAYLCVTDLDDQL
ncbi:MAG: hypothetical protein HY711_11780 [Candidatus Melainabacteria bacterium]|nr:hypothetical protein [Candidatus Melainabacteria bacterium]